jgi:predicted lipid-binding transport protein (Tim44 family)
MDVAVQKSTSRLFEFRRTTTCISLRAMLLSDRTKVVRAVLGFLAFCAVIGFVMGLRSALPRNSEDAEPQGPPAEANSNVVVEATAAQETPAATNEPATNEPADNADAAQAAEEKAATKAEQTKPVAPAPAAAPAEEAPSNDAVGQILDQQQNAAPPPPNLY